MRSIKFGFLGAFVLFGFSGSASAQFGMSGGVNLAKFISRDVAASETTKGLNLGLTVPLFSLGPLSVVPELYYAQKGGKEFNAFSLANGDFELDLSYIEIPLLARLTIPLNRTRTFSAYFAGGPAFAWKVDCTFSGLDESETDDCEETFGSLETALKKADRGVVASAGLRVGLAGVGGLQLDARLVRGLDRINEADTGPEIRNQAFTVMLGYYLER